MAVSIFSRFKTFGARDPHRPPEDIAFSVARFFQKGGSLQNYYMVIDLFYIIFINWTLFYHHCHSSNLTYRIIFFFFSIMAEQILVVLLVGHLLPQVMTMMHLLMNMVRCLLYF